MAGSRDAGEASFGESTLASAPAAQRTKIAVPKNRIELPCWINVRLPIDWSNSDSIPWKLLKQQEGEQHRFYILRGSEGRPQAEVQLSLRIIPSCRRVTIWPGSSLGRAAFPRQGHLPNTDRR